MAFLHPGIRLSSRCKKGSGRYWKKQFLKMKWNLGSCGELMSSLLVLKGPCFGVAQTKGLLWGCAVLVGIPPPNMVSGSSVFRIQ